MNRALVLTLAALAAVHCLAAGNPFDEAESMTRDLGRARELYRTAAKTDPDPERRERARVRAARIDWYVFHEPAPARTILAQVADTSREAATASIERALLETELTGDFAAARTAAERALSLAKTRADRDGAHIRHAAASIEEAKRARLGGKCPDDAAALRAAIAELRAVIDASGPDTDTSLLLLDGALLARDNDTALAAWRWYYGDNPSLVPASIPDRRALGFALAAARLYEDADLVWRDPCAPVTIDAEMKDIVTYTAALRRMRTIAAEQHRAVARKENNDAFQKVVLAELETLWKALTWKDAPPKFTVETAAAELRRRFGTVANMGKTEGLYDMVLGHVVRDEQRVAEQYGQRASLRFVQLDGMIAGGYRTWLSHGTGGTGGWSGDDEIVQLRPMYADGPIRKWRRLNDPDARARRDEEITDETKRDEARAKEKPINRFVGLQYRLERQYNERTRDGLAAQGLSGDALRDAFLARVVRDQFESSIWAHEGRHAIDKKIFRITNSTELEFRAKLSEIAFAPAPRGALNSILAPIGDGGSHGEANLRVLTGVEKWMRAHAAEIEGLDAQRALLPQLDRMTDEQLKAAFRSLDVLARPSS